VRQRIKSLCTPAAALVVQVVVVPVLMAEQQAAPAAPHPV
jgi:hypothetical protein